MSRGASAIRGFFRLVAVVALFLAGCHAVGAANLVPRTLGPTTRQLLHMQTSEPAGTLIISNGARTLDLVLDRNTVARYSVAIGRPGFTWVGRASVGRKAEWPDWHPPGDMRKRDPSLPDMVPAGPLNPLGARALYLYMNGRDTLYRIHGTNDASKVGSIATSGCFRMTNADIIELFEKIPVGTKVIVNE